MKKIELNLDDLKVESFHTTPEAAEGREGTVFGFIDDDKVRTVACLTLEPTCPFGCTAQTCGQPTCVGHTCGSCPDTC